MTKRSRYFLLLIGFITFLIGAPLIVLYVRGLVFDPQTGKFLSTGILAVRADPDQADIYINGELRRKKAGDIKFLKPGEYTVMLKREGYFDWSKRLNLRSNEVTWAQGASDKIHLLYQDTAPKILASSVSDFYISGDNLTYTSPGGITTASVREPDRLNTTAMPELATPTLQASPSGNLFLVRSGSTTDTSRFVFDRNEHKLYDISAISSADSQYAFSNSDELFLLNQGMLYKADFKDSDTDLLARNVYTFAVHNDSLYYTRLIDQGTVLAVSNHNGQNEQIIFSPVPLFKDAFIFVNFQKEIFILGDGTLYKINANLDRLTDGVSAWNFDARNSSLTIVHSGELSYFNTFDRRLNLITRSGTAITNPLAYNAINHTFFVKDGQVTAMEIDNHGQQNQNVLYESPAIKKIQASDDLKKIFVLDSMELKEIRIR